MRRIYFVLIFLNISYFTLSAQQDVKSNKQTVKSNKQTVKLIKSQKQLIKGTHVPPTNLNLEKAKPRSVIILDRNGLKIVESSIIKPNRKKKPKKQSKYTVRKDDK